MAFVSHINLDKRRLLSLSPAALEVATDNLVAHLRRHPDLALADVAYTLHAGRRAFSCRRMLVCDGLDDAIHSLEARAAARVLTHTLEPGDRPVAFLFPGQGSQYLGMAAGLYEAEPAFRAHVDRCAELLAPHLGTDIRTVLYPAPTTDHRPPTLALERSEGTDHRPPTIRSPVHPFTRSPVHPTPDTRLAQTQYSQPALFVVEYALAQLWMSWGVRPQALLGHSIGEYVAACLAGVFTLEDALALVALRGQLMQRLPRGAMLSVPLPEEELRPHLGPQLALAAVNGPALCTAAGPEHAIEALHAQLAARGLDCRQLQTSHAFHSQMMEPILAPFAEGVRKITLKPPKLPFVSNVTGTWITAAEATDPAYWGQHLRQPVRFADGVYALLQEPDRVLLEVGPGHTLSTLARQCGAAGRPVVTSLRRQQDQQPDVLGVLAALGKLWLAGVRVDWRTFYADERRRRLPLPAYPFERQRYWVEPRRLPQPVSRPRDEEHESAQATAGQPGDSFSLYPRPDLFNSYVAPSTPIERRIAAIWQELLGIQQVGLHDNFFELGGHSLTATQMAARLQAAFPVDLTLGNLFEATTVAQIAEIVEELLIEKIEALPEDAARALAESLFESDT